MGSKSKKCVNLTSDDPTSLFFWALITILFVLVIGNIILTLSIISFFRIGMGMESIEIVPESKTIKFFGSVDFQKVFKKDGLIESFRDVPLQFQGDESEIEFNLTDRKGQPHNRLVLNRNGNITVLASQLLLKDPETSESVFKNNLKILSNVNKATRNLVANTIHTSEISSPVNKKMEINALNIFVKGIEGTRIDGKNVQVTAKHGTIDLKSLNNSNVELIPSEYISLNVARLTKATKSNNGTRLQNKLYACLNKVTKKYTLVQVKMGSENDLKYVKC